MKTIRYCISLSIDNKATIKVIRDTKRERWDFLTQTTNMKISSKMWKSWRKGFKPRNWKVVDSLKALKLET